MFPVVMCSYCCSSCFFLRLLVLLLYLYSFDRVWALFLQSLPCRLVVFTVFSCVVTHTGCRRPPVLTSMLNQSWNTPLVGYCAAAFHASSFDLLYFCFLQYAISFCCCGVFSFDLCFGVLPCVMCFTSFCGGGFFLSVNDFLVSFFELGQFNTDIFSAWSRSSYPNVSCFLFLLLVWMFFPSTVNSFLCIDHESSHDTSVVASHVDHVVGLGVFYVSQISSLGQKVVNLFFFSFWRNEGRLFLGSLPEHRIEIVWHQPAFQPVTSSVTLVESVPAHTCTFRSFSKSQLSIEVSSNDWNVLVSVHHVFLDCFVHLLNVVVRIL